MYLKSLSADAQNISTHISYIASLIDLVVHFRAASGSNKMLSALLHREDQDGSVEGGAARLGTIVYRAKGNSDPRLTLWT